MTIVFWIIIALLLLMAAAFVLWPLLRKQKPDYVSLDDVNVAVHKQRLIELENERDQGQISAEQYEQARQEEERALLQDVTEEAQDNTPGGASSNSMVVTTLLALSALAIGLYWYLGDPHFLSPKAKYHHSIAAYQKELTTKLEKEPRDAQSWATLGRTYVMLGNFPQALQAYQKAYAIAGDSHAQLLVDYAEALGRQRGSNLQGRPKELIHKALQLDPKNTSALLLAGFAAYQQRDFKTSLRYWYRLKKIKPQTDVELDRYIAHAESVSGTKRVVVTASIIAKVALKKSLHKYANKDDIVFIYARASKGPRAPLAILRKRVSDLPLQVTLTDAMAMMPALRISNFPKIVIHARVSKSGSASKLPGDLYGNSIAIRNNRHRPVSVLINQRVPSR